MCVNPQTAANGKQFSCGVCNQCINARKNEWINRCMAERSTVKHTMALTLTYADDTPESRLRAAYFHYRDVQLFLKRLRKALVDRFGPAAEVRFVCCGEVGSKKGRVHWHILLFSDFDMLSVGSWSRYGAPLAREAVEVHPSAKTFSTWSLWPWGHVHVMIPDEDGISYVIKYCIKDAFSYRKSRGTAREGTAEDIASGLFRMSRKPGIGYPFLMQQLEKMREELRVLPEPLLPVPGARYRWRPRRVGRELLLRGLRAINDECKVKTGRDCAQWSSLLNALREDETALEILVGTEEERSETIGEQALELAAKTADNSGWYERRQTARQCGSTIACTVCLRSYYHDHGKPPEGIEVVRHEGGFISFREEGASDGYSLKRKQNDCARGAINPGCYSKDQRKQRVAFVSSNGSARHP